MPDVSIPGTTLRDLIKTHLADLDLSTAAWSEFLSTAPSRSFDARPAPTDHWLRVYKFRRDLAVERNDENAPHLCRLVDYLESHPSTEPFMVLVYDSVGAHFTWLTPDLSEVIACLYAKSNWSS